jgi:hypothetical protein
MFASTGIGNRVLVAGAIGAGVILVALMELGMRFVPRPRRRPILAASIAIVAASAVARLEFVEEYWAEAPALQRQVLASAQGDLAKLPAGSTVILDGVCPYHGPAIVFETYWDVGAPLSLALQRKIKDDAISPRMTLTSSALDSEIYGEPAHYPFGPTLFIYNPRLHLLARLTDAAAVRRYFSRADRRSVRARPAMSAGACWFSLLTGPAGSLRKGSSRPNRPA